jgi:DNA-binding NarL/FixJ family response regulator
MAIRVLLVDDFQILSWGVQRLIEADSNFKFLGTASTHQNALSEIVTKKPDVVLINAAMLEGEQVEFIPEILKISAVNILVYSGKLEDQLHDLVVIKGARGILNKNDTTQILLKAIDRIHAGEIWVNRNATSRILSEIAKSGSITAKTARAVEIRVSHQERA